MIPANMENPEFKRVNDMLTTVMDMGELMVMTGADATRVEDTATRICSSFGVEDIHAFCIGSMLQVSVRMSDGQYCTQMRRVASNDNNLARMEELNDMSRRICSGRMTIEEAARRIRMVRTLECYKPVWYYLAGMLGSSAFSVFFGGTLMDGLCAVTASIPVTFMDRHPFKHSTRLVDTMLKSLVAGVTVNALMLLGIGDNTDMICIGVIMLLIPGMMFGNAMQDFMRADVFSGCLKLVHALLLAMMIALGFSIAMILFGKWAL